MKHLIITIFLTGMLSAAHADGILSSKQKASLLGRPHTVVYDAATADGTSRLRISNISGGGFVLTKGDRIVGYSDTGHFSPQSAPPAMLDMLQAMQQATADAPATSIGATGQPLLGDISWNQDAPYNDLCPQYDLNSRCPTGCVATAMAQLMRYHKWPQHGMGSHAYQPVIMSGNTLEADFGSTTYLWDAMLPNYSTASTPADGYTMDECRTAVATLMLHCGVAVDMVYYTQSGATDYDVPPALITYFGYDRSMAYRKREHYGWADWLQIIHDEIAEGRPVLAYGRAAAGGHAYVFDGMDDEGFIHVNWGWGGMSNGYFQTSALTPAAQGIGGSDGGFNYTQRIITGIRPADGAVRDYDVELTSTEGLAAGRTKVAQGSDVTIRLTGKVVNHGFQDAHFDYALLLLSAKGDTVSIISGPADNTLAREATDYAPTFGTVNLGTLPEGTYALYPACRMTGGNGRWLRIRDNYIGYVNRLDVTATATDITFSQPDYFQLKATDTEIPSTLWNGSPMLITTTVTNEGDVEYHGEVKAQLRRGTTVVSSTSNYIVDLLPGASTVIRFTDAFSAEAGDYTLCLVDDDGSVISPRFSVTMTEAPATGTVAALQPITIAAASPELIQATATVTAHGGVFAGLLYTFIYSADGGTQMGSLFPEYVMLDADGATQQVLMTGNMENGVPGTTYRARLAVYDGKGFTFLTDDNASRTFVLADGQTAVKSISATTADGRKTVHDLLGHRLTGNRKAIGISNGRKAVYKQNIINKK